MNIKTTFKSLFLLSLLFNAHFNLALATSENPELKPLLNCWDSTFAYNTLSLKQSASGIELSLNGSNYLSKVELDFGKNFSSFNGSGKWKQISSFIHFRNNECLLETDPISKNLIKIECNHKASEDPSSLFYILSHHEDFSSEKSIEIISPYKVGTSKLLWEKGQAAQVILQDTQYHDGSANISQHSFSYHADCNTKGMFISGGTHWGEAKFPDRLREYLKNTQK